MDFPSYQCRCERCRNDRSQKPQAERAYERCKEALRKMLLLCQVCLLLLPFTWFSSAQNRQRTPQGAGGPCEFRRNALLCMGLLEAPCSHQSISSTSSSCGMAAAKR